MLSTVTASVQWCWAEDTKESGCVNKFKMLISSFWGKAPISFLKHSCVEYGWSCMCNKMPALQLQNLQVHKSPTFMIKSVSWTFSYQSRSGRGEGGRAEERLLTDLSCLETLATIERRHPSPALPRASNNCAFCFHGNRLRPLAGKCLHIAQIKSLVAMCPTCILGPSS